MSGSLAKNSKWYGSSPTIHLGITPLLLPHVLANRLPHTATEMKNSVHAKDYVYILHISKIGKSCLLEESTYQVLWEASLLSHLVVGHEELLLPYASSPWIEDLKPKYDLVEEKVANFEIDHSRLCSRLYQMPPFLEEVKEYGSSVTWSVIQ